MYENVISAGQVFSPGRYNDLHINHPKTKRTKKEKPPKYKQFTRSSLILPFVLKLNARPSTKNYIPSQEKLYTLQNIKLKTFS